MIAAKPSKWVVGPERSLQMVSLLLALILTVSSSEVWSRQRYGRLSYDEGMLQDWGLREKQTADLQTK